MPCHTSLSSVLDSRAICDGLVRANGAALCRSRRCYTRSTPFYQLSIRHVESARRTVQDNAKRRSELERLDGAIDPNDLAATLEAHRDSNKASVIRTISTPKGDPSVLRPSFLETTPLRKDKPDVTASAVVEKVPSTVTPHSSGHGVTRSISQPSQTLIRSGHGSRPQDRTKTATAVEMLSDMFVGRQESTRTRPQKEARAQPNPDEKNGHPLEATRRRFLRDFERPRAAFSAVRDRRSYFDTIRRVRIVLQAKQNSARTGGRLRNVPEDLIEYVGSKVPMKPSPFNPTIPEPWGWPATLDTGTRQERLEEEINKFAEWMKPTPAEEAARAAVFRQVNNLIQKTTRNMSTAKFGSQTTGLAMPMSDIDIRIYPKAESSTRNFMNAVDTVYDALRRDTDYMLVVKHQGRFPLLGATHVASGLSLQLVVCADTSASREKVKTYLAEFPNLKKLYMVIKTIFDMRGLSDVWYGGFGSYTIFMMVVASLKHQDPPQQSMAQQLVNFLEFYGSLDTYTYGVGVDPPRLFTKKTYPKKTEITAAIDNPLLQGQQRVQVPQLYQRYLLCLQDPVDPLNDLGKKSSTIKDVQMTLKSLSQDVQTRLSGTDRDVRSGPVLRHLVGRCDQLYNESRTRLDLFGEDVMELNVGRADAK